MVSIEESAPTERAALFVRAFGWNRRERELLDHLVVGMDPRKLAQ